MSYSVLVPILLALSTNVFFFFNDTATTEIYTLSLHDALPIFLGEGQRPESLRVGAAQCQCSDGRPLDADLGRDRKSTRLNSSHSQISYAVFCLKKKKIADHERSTVT